MSIRSRDASNACPRCAAAAATTTATSPIARLPDAVHRRDAVDLVGVGDPVADRAHRVQRRRVGGVVETHDALVAVVVADPADEQGHPTAPVSLHARQHVGDVERGLLDLDEADERVGHASTLAALARLSPRRTVGRMSNDPGDGPDEGQNPFKGTPFEQFFAGGMPAGMPDLNQLMGQFQSLMQPYDGPLNWDAADDLARKTVAANPDPSPSQRQKDAVADAVRLADHWLDEATGFPSGVTSTAAWSRAEWIVGTLDVWKVLVEPVAEQSVSGLSGALPAEMQASAGPLLGIIGKAVGAMLATQVGSGLGALAGEVLSVSDIGLPLAAPGKAALVPANVTAFAEGLDVTEDDVLLYLALREAAHQRLFAHVPWLREHLIGAVTDFARGIEINAEGIQQRMEEQLRGVDPTNPEAMQQLLEGGLFDLPESPAQKAALERLEIALALVEGWVDEVVGQATAERMPAAAKLQEAVRRRRAAGGPAEQTFAALVGLELRPAPAPRRLDPVGLAAHPAGHRGPRRRVDAPRPAAHLRRPRRPARLPRGRRRAGGAQRGRLRRRAAQAARRGVTLHADAVARAATPGGRPPPSRRRCATATSRTSRRTPTGCRASAGPTTSPPARSCSATTGSGSC